MLFILFTTSIIFFFIMLLTIKNECLKTQYEIEQSHKLLTANANLVKELQSNKDYLASEQHINKILSSKMNVATPETLLIYLKWENFLKYIIIE